MRVSIVPRTVRVTCCLSPIAAMLLKNILKGSISLQVGLVCSVFSVRSEGKLDLDDAVQTKNKK